MHMQLTIPDGNATLPGLIDFIRKARGGVSFTFVIHSYDNPNVHTLPFTEMVLSNKCLYLASEDQLKAADYQHVEEAVISVFDSKFDLACLANVEDVYAKAICLIHGADYVIWQIVSEDTTLLETLQGVIVGSYLEPARVELYAKT